MLRLVLRDLGPVEEVLDRQALSLNLKLGEARDDVPRKVDRVLLDVRESICWSSEAKGPTPEQKYFPDAEGRSFYDGQTWRPFVRVRDKQVSDEGSQI